MAKIVGIVEIEMSLLYKRAEFCIITGILQYERVFANLVTIVKSGMNDSDQEECL